MRFHGRMLWTLEFGLKIAALSAADGCCSSNGEKKALNVLDFKCRMICFIM